MEKSAPKVPSDRTTRDRLLDAAEHLFGIHGYKGAGMRMLAEEAGVNLGAATYHFGSKDALYIETFLRRFRVMNAERLRLLRESEEQAEGKPLPVARIVDCMIRPLFQSGLKHPSFQLLLARNLFMPPPFLHAVIRQELEPNIKVFQAALLRALPAMPDSLLHLRTMFGMGALLVFSFQMAQMVFERHATFYENVLEEMVRFISAGLQSELPPSPEQWLPFPFPPDSESR
ncbi:MAG: TetR/AcrR family transcriptional regulator [Syntrophobacteraceae bacterium]|nr:TetR/AcrR family transcriptional regulator [Syntrophobacteraceae bacterium]